MYNEFVLSYFFLHSTCCRYLARTRVCITLSKGKITFIFPHRPEDYSNCHSLCVEEIDVDLCDVKEHPNAVGLSTATVWRGVYVKDINMEFFKDELSNFMFGIF
ncbi:LOW QUALITY PROTEIN: hypothetical protein PanWU01x14_173480 [Parasponia andersonii]|uniref:Uncharacterized protein n=1 Tax=Parasponia andersonii TaxID=3476 RepID=A0A2P5C8R4_PARAD|nr:LOW QUALITY PROTEIN: hypothetical protein PanWU01x14_173480 [Parasponia andersonii]